MYELRLPPDLERLQTLRAYIARQQAEQATIVTFLGLLAEAVDQALAAAVPAGPPDGYRIQPVRVLEGRAVLHRSDCWMSAGGAVISRDEALMALADDVTRAGLKLCESCRPVEALEP